MGAYGTCCFSSFRSLEIRESGRSCLWLMLQITRLEHLCRVARENRKLEKGCALRAKIELVRKGFTGELRDAMVARSRSFPVRQSQPTIPHCLIFQAARYCPLSFRLALSAARPSKGSSRFLSRLSGVPLTRASNRQSKSTRAYPARFFCPGNHGARRAWQHRRIPRRRRLPPPRPRPL